MQNKFSPALIKKIRDLIFKRAGVKISKNQAVIYLDKLSRLMLSIVDITDQEKDKNKITK